MQALQVPQDNARVMTKNKQLSSMTNGSAISGLTDISGASSSMDPYAYEAPDLTWEGELSSDHIKQIEKASVFKPGKAQDLYDYLAKNYEGIYQRLAYPDPEKVADMALKQCKEAGFKVDKVSVLDLGCGTGLVGKALWERGFRHITGCDISDNMMELASLKDCYEKLQVVDLSVADNFPQNLKNQFEIVTCAGLVNHHHMDWNLFENMILALKLGGLVVYTSSFSYLGHFWDREVCQLLIQEGRFKFMEDEEFHSFGGVRAVGRFFKAPMKVQCYRNYQEQRNTWTTRQGDELREQI